MINTIIFDAEGVVIDSETVWDEEQIIFLSRRGHIYERNKVKHLVTGKSLRESTAVLQEIYGFSGDVDKMVIERKSLVHKLFMEKVDFIYGFQMFFKKVSLTYKVCIATSLDRDILSLINCRLNLSILFSGNIFSIADVGYLSKPNPEIFLYAASQMQSDPIDCLVIEDSPYGIEAAKRADMKCLALATTYEAIQLAQADMIFGSYEEIELTKFSLLS